MNRMPTPPPVMASATPAMTLASGQVNGPGRPGGPSYANPGPGNASPYPSAAPQPMRIDPSSSMMMAAEDGRFLRPWMFFAAVILIGAVIAAIVGLSGPDIPSGLAPQPAPASAPAAPAK